MSEDTKPSNDLITELTADIVSAYVGGNAVPLSELPKLIASVADSFRRVGQRPKAVPQEPLQPAVSIKKSITPSYLISLEDGKKYQTLKRHLGKLGLTPDLYRAKWGLPFDYPMVAPEYSAKRSAIAKSQGLGKGPTAKPKKRKAKA